MGKQKGAHTKKAANKIKRKWSKQGWNAHVAKNPPKLVGRRGIKKYTVVAAGKRK